MLVGPERALSGMPEQRARVSLAEAEDALGPVVAELKVAESGVREFVVPWHQQPNGRIVAANPSGGNQVSWSPDLDDVTLTRAADALHTSVHFRFVLRHLTTMLLEDDLGGRSLHAVTATLLGADGQGVLAVAGATRSGKTRLVNRLVAAGLVGEVVDDDCPVLTADGSLATLVPRRYEVARAVGNRLDVLVVLSPETDRARVVDVAEAHELVQRTATPWPAGWLPVGERPELPPLPPTCGALVVPARDADATELVAEVVRSRRG